MTTRLAPLRTLPSLALLALFPTIGCYTGVPSPFPGGDGPGVVAPRKPEGTSVLVEIIDVDGKPIPQALVTVADAHLPLTDGHSPPPPDTPTPALAPPPSPLARPFARTARGALYMADGAGRLLLENLASGRFVARVDAPGHAPASVVVDLRDGAHRRRVTLLPVAATLPFSAEHGAHLVHRDIVVDVPPLGLVDARGEPVVGLVEAAVVPLDPFERLTAAPGPLTAIRADGSGTDLESVFMAEVTFYKDGLPLQLAPGVTARVELRLPDGFTGKAGDTIPAWYLDLEAGQWREEGVGEVGPSSTDPGRLAWFVEVSHFTWWNADNPVSEHSCFAFTLKDAYDKPVPNVQIFAVGIDYNGISQQTTDAEGHACLAIKRGAKAQVLVGSEDPNDPNLLMAPFVIEGTEEASACNGEGNDCIPVNLEIPDDKAPECDENESKACPYPQEYADKLGTGVCTAGSSFCIGGKWQPCDGQVLPQDEPCDTPFVDEDCDGNPDNNQEGCECTWLSPPKSCYGGPLETLGVGQCKAGKQTCDLQTKKYGACESPADVEPEVIDDCATLDQFDPSQDEDCDGNPGCGHHDWHRGFGDAATQFAFDVAPATNFVFVVGRSAGQLELDQVPPPPPPTQPAFIAGFGLNGQPAFAFDLGPAWVGELDAVAVADDLFVVGTIAGNFSYNGNACKVDGVAPNDPGDVAVARFDAAGNCKWIRHFPGVGVQRGTSITATAGGIAIAGTVANGIVLKGKQNNIEVNIPLPVQGEDHVFAVTLDLDGIYDDAYFLDTNWPANLPETPVIASTPFSEAVFLAGAFGGTMKLCNHTVEASPGAADMFVARLLNGNCTWHTEFAAESPRAFSAAADLAGNVVLAAEVDGPTDLGAGVVGEPGDNIALVKLDLLGDPVWGEVFRGSFPLAAYGGQTVAVDAAGRVAVAGSFATATTIQDEPLLTDVDGSIFVAKFGAGGNLQWAQALGLADRQDAGAVALDADNWTYLVGGFRNQITFTNPNVLWTFLEMKVQQPGDLGDAFIAHLHI